MQKNVLKIQQFCVIKFPVKNAKKLVLKKFGVKTFRVKIIPR